MQRADEIAAEKNRALKAALNAELRKTKATLLEQAIPLLDKMARKGKGLTPEKIAARQAQVRSRAGHFIPSLLKRQCSAHKHMFLAASCGATAASCRCSSCWQAGLLWSIGAGGRWLPSLCNACIPAAHLQVAELKQTIEEISNGVHSARKPQRVGLQLLQEGGMRAEQMVLRAVACGFHLWSAVAAELAWPDALRTYCASPPLLCVATSCCAAVWPRQPGQGRRDHHQRNAGGWAV